MLFLFQLKGLLRSGAHNTILVNLCIQKRINKYYPPTTEHILVSFHNRITLAELQLKNHLTTAIPTCEILVSENVREFILWKRCDVFQDLRILSVNLISYVIHVKMKKKR